MNQAINWQLTEAVRRLNLSERRGDKRPLTKKWLGLGTASAYRASIDAGLMVFHDGKTPPKRCCGWLCLTDRGIIELIRHARIFSQPFFYSVVKDRTEIDQPF